MADNSPTNLSPLNIARPMVSELFLEVSAELPAFTLTSFSIFEETRLRSSIELLDVTPPKYCYWFTSCTV